MKKTKTFKVTISETLEKEIEVQAINEDEAKTLYQNEKIVLDSSNHSQTDFDINGWKENKKEGCWKCKGDSILHFSKENDQEVLEEETCEKCGDLR